MEELKPAKSFDDILKEELKAAKPKESFRNIFNGVNIADPIKYDEVGGLANMIPTIAISVQMNDGRPKKGQTVAQIQEEQRQILGYNIYDANPIWGAIENEQAKEARKWEVKNQQAMYQYAKYEGIKR